ncbi:MAG TPA: hypothetical protein VE398_05705 [Acidobacteriota bacterium]|nr:hypothetical protein [Acidobacteriota bacterium]
MPTERARLLELALENLVARKGQIDQEIAEITRELGSGRRAKAALAARVPAADRVGAVRRRSRFSKVERLRRSARMKAYWANWRKQKKNQK